MQFEEKTARKAPGKEPRYVLKAVTLGKEMQALKCNREVLSGKASIHQAATYVKKRKALKFSSWRGNKEKLLQMWFKGGQIHSKASS